MQFVQPPSNEKSVTYLSTTAKWDQVLEQEFLGRYEKVEVSKCVAEDLWGVDEKINFYYKMKATKHAQTAINQVQIIGDQAEKVIEEALIVRKKKLKNRNSNKNN